MSIIALLCAICLLLQAATFLYAAYTSTVDGTFIIITLLVVESIPVITLVRIPRCEYAFAFTLTSLAVVHAQRPSDAALPAVVHDAGAHQHDEVIRRQPSRV